MRVIAGLARRIPLAVAPGSAARPFLEMARGALFNALGPRLEGARVLDLYAGSGALGIEALSRGAAFCRFVEADPASAGTLKDNLARCRLDGLAEVRLEPAERAVPRLDDRFDLMFLDPPFALAGAWASDPGGRILREALPPRLSPGGRLVFRLEEGQDAPAWPGLVLVWDRTHGRSRILLYAPAGEGDDA